MGLPLIAAAACLGALVGRFLGERFLTDSPHRMSALLVGVLLVAGADQAEQAFHLPPRTEVITSSVRVSAPIDRAWQAILTVDAMNAPKPFLLRAGWYWRWFERLGTQAEHRYMLQSLERELSR